MSDPIISSSLSFPCQEAVGDVAAVVIGRNEGDRLIRCFESLLAHLGPSQIVYVDSGSTDQSCHHAQLLGIGVVELDTSMPFTAARARNTGLEWILENCPTTTYVQFVDGDCELICGWLEAGVSELEKNSRLAVACGRRRERFPEASPYNRLADMEWNTPVGEAMACGGDALMRVSALKQVTGYNPSLICGEEPEMCIRMRRQGWRIQRLDQDMTWHDVDMHSLSQWWKRSVRGGWAIAEGFAMYGSAPERYMSRENTSGWIWGAILPLIMMIAIWPTQGLSLLLLALYGVLVVRIYQYRYRQYGDCVSDAWLYAILTMFSKFPQVLGQLSYWLTRWRGRTATLIEYKTPVTKGV